MDRNEYCARINCQNRILSSLIPYLHNQRFGRTICAGTETFKSGAGQANTRLVPPSKYEIRGYCSFFLHHPPRLSTCLQTCIPKDNFFLFGPVLLESVQQSLRLWVSQHCALERPEHGLRGSSVLIQVGSGITRLPRRKSSGAGA